jgi:hypothetical protein
MARGTYREDDKRDDRVHGRNTTLTDPLGIRELNVAISGVDFPILGERLYKDGLASTAQPPDDGDPDP